MTTLLISPLKPVAVSVAAPSAGPAPHSAVQTGCAPPKTPEKRPCAPEDGIRKMASLTARNRLFHDIVPDFRDRPAMENRVRFSCALFWGSMIPTFFSRLALRLPV